MARWRPGPLVADSLLAIVLAVASLGITSAGGGAESTVKGTGWTLSTPPSHPRPGDVWNARIAVFRDGAPNWAPENVMPLLTVQSDRTGAWSTRAATPTDVRGFYRARVVYRDTGPFNYSVLVGDAGTTSQSQDPAMPADLFVLTLLSALPIALRRRYSLAVLAVTAGAGVAIDIAYDRFAFLGALVALYTVAAHVGRPRSLVAAGSTAAVLPLLQLGEAGLGVWETVAIFAVFAAAWLLGDNLRARRERQRANVRRAAAEEQARISRELHDVIGHSVSVMTIQAAAAGDAFDSRPAAVRDALHAIETTGRETLAELRRLLAGDAAGFEAAPGLDRLDALADRVRAAGLDVELSATARPESLPASVDLSAYRIVQEALTNTLKHAQASTARVDVRQVNGALEIAVVDDGRGAGDTPPGHGIIGMQERAAVFGGSLTAGPVPGGGFAVHAWIPIKEPA